MAAAMVAGKVLFRPSCLGVNQKQPAGTVKAADKRLSGTSSSGLRALSDSSLKCNPLSSVVQTGPNLSKLGLHQTQRWHQQGQYPSRLRPVCAVSEDRGKEIYSGVYGPWSIETPDRLEVLAYRSGLVTAAGAFLLAASTAFLPDSPVEDAILSSLDGLYALGAGGLGLALVLIHIYVTPIKRALQLLWLVGALGSAATAVNFAWPAGSGLVEFVLDRPGAVWAVGPLFAALTGLVFKEGLCYGKLEAAALFFVIPTLLLGHLSGLMDAGVEKGFLAAWVLLFTIFAARKFSQPIKDDIGDKSVFIFQALPREQQEALLAKLQAPPSSSSASDSNA